MEKRKSRRKAWGLSYFLAERKSRTGLGLSRNDMKVLESDKGVKRLTKRYTGGTRRADTRDWGLYPIHFITCTISISIGVYVNS